MSLLMEALRKAEEAKRRGHLERAHAETDTEAGSARADADTPQSFSLEEREPGVTPAYILDNFVVPQGDPEPSGLHGGQNAAEDEEPDTAGLYGYLSTEPEAEDLTPPASPRHPAAGSGTSAQQLAAASIFNAKHSAPKRHGRSIALAGALVLVLAGGGGVWWYLAGVASPTLVNPSLSNIDLASRGFLGDPPVGIEPVPAATAINVTPADVGVAPVQTTPPAPEANAGSTVDTAAPAVAATTDPAAAADEPAQPAPATPPPVPATPVAAPQETATAPAEGLSLPAAGSRSNLQISRSTSPRRQNPVLQSAWDNLQRGDLQTATLLYQEVLATAPNNRDALLGLAQVSMRQGDTAAARAGYARLLQLNPRDPLARTGLLQTVEGIDPREHESELRALLAQYPDVAPLSFALGNLYAAQQRWSEAQAAYFTALLNAGRGADPVHPDYAFNLAVSLEQLNQRTAALDYYRRANELALAITPGFDLELLKSRLTFLEQNLP